MSVQFPRDSPLQLNQGIPTGGRRRPLAGEDLVKVVVSVGFTGGPQPVALQLHDSYFTRIKVLSREGAAPATGRDTLIKLQGRVARKLDTHDSENRPAGLPS